MVKKNLCSSNDIKIYIKRVYSSTPSKSTLKQPSGPSSSSSSTINTGDYIKSNLNKAIYFTSSTLNRLYLRENVLEKLNNLSRNYLNEALKNVYQLSSNDIKKSVKKEDNKKKLINGETATNVNKTNVVAATRSFEVNAVKAANRVTDQIKDQTKFLCNSIRKCSSILIKTLYIEALNKHLYDNIEMRKIVFEEKIDRHLVDLKKYVDDKRLISNINECLALLGVINLDRKRGINLLSLDGGGAKGFVTIEVLKKIEQETGKRIYELFDHICGTSTGAVLACLIGVFKLSLNECESYYKKFVDKIFERNTAASISNLLMTQSW
jgi:hypothetical protein